MQGFQSLPCVAKTRVLLCLLRPVCVCRVLQGHTGWINDVALSRSGNQAVTISGDGTARVWDTKKCKCLQVWAIHSRPIVTFVHSTTVETTCNCHSSPAMSTVALQSGNNSMQGINAPSCERWLRCKGYTWLGSSNLCHARSIALAVVHDVMPIACCAPLIQRQHLAGTACRTPATTAMAALSLAAQQSCMRCVQQAPHMKSCSRCNTSPFL